MGEREIALGAMMEMMMMMDGAEVRHANTLI